MKDSFVGKLKTLSWLQVIQETGLHTTEVPVRLSTSNRPSTTVGQHRIRHKQKVITVAKIPHLTDGFPRVHLKEKTGVSSWLGFLCVCLCSWISIRSIKAEAFQRVDSADQSSVKANADSLAGMV